MAKFSELKKTPLEKSKLDMLLIIDCNEKYPKELTDNTLYDLTGEAPLFVALLLPDSEQNYYKLVPLVNMLIDTAAGVLLFSSSEV